MTGAAPRDGQEELHATNSRDAFTLTLLKHVANKLGVQYTGNGVDTSDSIVMDELGHIKAEIRSRERVLGIENMSLIPLYVKAGDLSPTSEDSLRFYKKAMDVVEANKELKRHSTMMKDVTVSNFAELGSRFFRYGEYHLAEKLFTMAASICHDKSAGACWANPFSTAQCKSPNGLQRLQGHLWDWQKSAEASQQNLSILFSGTIQRPHRQQEMRDACTQTELTEYRATTQAGQGMGTGDKIRELKGVRNAENLKRLVEYTFDPLNGDDGFTGPVLPKSRTTMTLLQSEHVSEPSSFLALQESIDRIALRVDGKFDSINASGVTLGNGLQPR
ncbi:hypothetical protein TraAM80_00979 [Trypanosoma rangeli]|uniref:Uncharacterized protein n=1 Tax=Trypanosoma rangeli TaxID=5698 RepID=A0A422P0S1_TRYRA|nr:uncharacterized protein TraAM80_00979 [Trypanosoma rangeli]RNF11342.1 hypothetical protein TraAM80_00979 [Trypanosoma rangeli]|eukprot:RNF11342.1 hypothetical protein TraAM80_00979 [Trypanosoma rangeli]